MAADNIEVAVKAYTEEVDKGFQKAGKAVDKFGNKLGSNISKVKKFTNLINEAFSLDNIAPWAGVIKNATNQMIALTKAQVNYNKNMQKLQVAYGQVNSSGEKLVKTMADISGLDEAELTKSLGTFRQYASTLGIVSDKANMLSENLFKLSNDLASFYGEDTEDMARRLISAMTGETEALKVLGADVSDNAIKQKALSLGVKENTSNMSAASKAILRYLLVVDQLKNAQGNFAKTINDVSNQTKIWNAQINTLKRQLGAFLLPILQTILPVLNAILMVVNELLGMLLGLFGIKIPTSSIVSGFDSIINGLDNTSSSAKEAQKSLRGFDKLNVITTPTSSGNGGGGGGIPKELLDAMKEYDDMLADAHNKAVEIRNTIMEWLGFGKDANGEWKFMKVTFGTIAASAIVIGTIIATFVKIGKVIRKIKEIFGITSKATSFLTTLKKISGVAVTIAGVFLTIDGILKILDGDTLKGILRTIEGISLIVAGIAVLFGGWTVALIAAAVALVAYITELIVENWDKIKEWLSGIWDTIYEKVIQPIVDFLTPFANWVYDNVIQPIIDFLSPIFDACWDLMTSIYDSVKEIISGIIDAISSIFAKIWEINKKIIEIFVELGKAFYNYVIKPIWEKYIKPGFQWIYNTLIKPIINLFVDVGTWVYNHIIKPIWDKIKRLKDKAVGLFKSIGTAVIDFISGSFKAAINSVLAAIERNINRFIKLLNGAIKIINKIPGVDIDPIDLIAIPRLADGGFPKQGELFIAREAGAEMVGSINNKTAVANNDQIVDGISAGVAKAIMATGRNVNVNITAEGDAEGLLDFITFKQKQKDRQYGF